MEEIVLEGLALDLKEAPMMCGDREERKGKPV
jgi:hypothetical protein